MKNNIHNYFQCYVYLKNTLNLFFKVILFFIINFQKVVSSQKFITYVFKVENLFIFTPNNKILFLKQ